MLVSEAARNASLDNDYGTTRGPNAAPAHEVALLDTDGLEVTGFGYARAYLPADAWEPAEGGTKSATVQFDAPFGEWTSAVGFALYDYQGNVWDSADLTELLEVTGSAPQGPTLVVTVRYAVQVIE